MPINHSHLTAKERDKISFPTKWLYRNQLLSGNILDFGCGLGADVKALEELGLPVIGYDPFYAPDFPAQKFDTIICNYVFNVLEIDFQEDLLLQISSLIKENGCAYIVVRRDLKYEGFRTHKIHQKTTYQRNVILPFESIFSNDFCEIYKMVRLSDNPTKTSCIFCRPSSKLKYIAESSNVYAVYDGYPVSKGHALIIPKLHIADYFELQKNVLDEVWEVVSFVKEYMFKLYSPDGFNVGINIGTAAGQTVFHAHIHLIPRYSNDVDNPKGGVRHVIPKKGYY